MNNLFTCPEYVWLAGETIKTHVIPYGVIISISKTGKILTYNREIFQLECELTAGELIDKLDIIKKEACEVKEQIDHKFSIITQSSDLYEETYNNWLKFDSWKYVDTHGGEEIREQIKVVEEDILKKTLSDFVENFNDYWGKINREV